MQKLIRELLGKKVLLSPEILDQALGKPADELVQLSQGHIVLTSLEPPKARPAYEVRSWEGRERMSPADISAFYKAKFATLKKILAAKASPLSISKIGSSYADVEAIGLVRERIESGFIIEDGTGTLAVRHPAAPDIGDVVAVKGGVKEGMMFAKELLYPDIPLKRQIAKLRKTAILCSGKTAGEADFIFSFGSGGIAVQSPAHITVNAEESVRILGYRPVADITMKQAESFLRKRHLGLPEDAGCLSQGHVIEDAPEVLWITSPRNEKAIYKGVLIVLSEDVKIDLFSKEVEFLGLKERPSQAVQG